MWPLHPSSIPPPHPPSTPHMHLPTLEKKSSERIFCHACHVWETRVKESALFHATMEKAYLYFFLQHGVIHLYSCVRIFRLRDEIIRIFRLRDEIIWIFRLRDEIRLVWECKSLSWVCKWLCLDWKFTNTAMVSCCKEVWDGFMLFHAITVSCVLSCYSSATLQKAVWLKELCYSPVTVTAVQKKGWVKSVQFHSYNVVSFPFEDRYWNAFLMRANESYFLFKHVDWLISHSAILCLHFSIQSGASAFVDLFGLPAVSLVRDL